MCWLGLSGDRPLRVQSPVIVNDSPAGKPGSGINLIRGINRIIGGIMIPCGKHFYVMVLSGDRPLRVQSPVIVNDSPSGKGRG